MSHCTTVRRLILAALIMMQISCTVTHRAPLEPIADEARVQVLGESVGDPGKAISSDQFVIGAASTGAAGGAVVGTLASVSCGPFIMFCAPLAAGAGVVVGFVAGGIFGSATAINKKEQETFNTIVQSTFADRSPREYLVESFREQADQRWTLTDENVEWVINLRLDEFRVIQHSPDRFSLEISGSFTLLRPTVLEKNPRRYAFQYVTPARELEFFLDESGSNFQAEFARGIDSLANRMISSL